MSYNFYKKRNIFLFCLFFIIVIQIKVFSLTVSPFYVVIETLPNKPGTEIVNIINDSNVDSEIKAILMDFEYDKKGNKITKPAGTSSNSIAKYVKISPNNFLLKPNESKEVKISIDVPEKSIGGKQALVYFEGIPFLKETSIRKTPKIKMGVRLGVLILQETTGTVITKSRIKSVKIDNPSLSKPLVLNIDVINEGNSHLITTASAAIMKDDDTFIGRIDFNKMIILPNKIKTLTGEWGGELSKGTYHAIITYQYTEDKNIVIDKVFQIK
ncbi:MAG: hypothetical protein AABZ74_08175 [Cyanobacteriota bacterium]